MIQFNLLPDVKLEYMKTERTKRMLTTIASISAAVALGILLLSFFVVYVVQKASINNLNKDIKKFSGQIQNSKDLNKILTVQNQLTSLTSLHEAKLVPNRTFGYLSEVTPANVSLNKLDIDFAANTILIGGNAPSLDAVYVYTDSLKSTSYILEDSNGKTAAFSGIVLKSYVISDNGVTFSISANFDPKLFMVVHDVKLDVPKGPRTSKQELFDERGR